MKKRVYRLMVCASIMCLAFWFTACSGGGGSDGGSTGLTYTGETSAAAISQDNADTLAAGALDAGSSGSAFDLNGVAALSGTDPGAGASDRPLLLGVARTLENAVGNVDFAAASGANTAAAVQSDSGPLDGPCGGSASYSVSVDTNTGVFSGNFTFNAFCADGTTVTGSAGFSGLVDTSTDPAQLESFTFSFSALTVTSDSESATMNGNIAISAADSSITMNMTIQNNTTDWMCKVEDYMMVVDDYGTYADISISGRFYDQDYGYVDFETSQTQPLRVYSGEEYPSSGELILSGAVGAGSGRTSARLTAVDATHCRVDVDGDGNGSYEVTSGNILWSEL